MFPSNQRETKKAYAIFVKSPRTKVYENYVLQDLQELSQEKIFYKTSAYHTIQSKTAANHYCTLLKNITFYVVADCRKAHWNLKNK